MTQIDVVERLKDAQKRLSDGDEQNYGNVSYFANEAIDIAIAEITVLRVKVAALKRPTAPDGNGFFVGQSVEEFTGDYKATGEIRGRYTTCAGLVRYVVEVKPQGFQHIFSAHNIRPLP